MQSAPPDLALRPIPAPLLAGGLLLSFLALLLLPRAGVGGGLWTTVLVVGVAFAAWIAVLVLRARARGDRLEVGQRFKAPHVVQTGVQIGIYAYWAMHWDEVVPQLPLIFGQLAFLLLFELCLSWTMGRKHRLGFGAVPIVSSTNLFLWFIDDLYGCQLLMLVVASLTKEFVKWERGGRRVHIFNPSGVALALVAYVLIATDMANLTRGHDISQSLGFPPYAYENIFLLGLIIMSMVPVVLITASAALTAVGLGVLYTAATGSWHYIDTDIPIAVFLGMTLLATDPVTSPQRLSGRVIFGALFGAAAFGFYDLLGHFNRPGQVVTFFDKLVFLPVLNLMARRLDRIAGWLEARARWLVLRRRWLHLLFWVGAFWVIRPGLVAHPGADPGNWQGRCEAGDKAACVWALDGWITRCEASVPEGCHNAALMFDTGEGAPADAARAADLYGRACTGGLAGACAALGAMHRDGRGVPADPRQAVEAFALACPREPGACAEAVGALLRGGPVPRDAPRAAALLQRACDFRDGVSCANLAVMLRRGDGVPKDEARAEILRQRACAAGVEQACAWRR